MTCLPGYGLNYVKVSVSRATVQSEQPFQGLGYTGGLGLTGLFQDHWHRHLFLKEDTVPPKKLHIESKSVGYFEEHVFIFKDFTLSLLLYVTF